MARTLERGTGGWALDLLLECFRRKKARSPPPRAPGRANTSPSRMCLSLRPAAALLRLYYLASGGVHSLRPRSCSRSCHLSGVAPCSWKVVESCTRSPSPLVVDSVPQRPSGLLPC
ncbi:hypothetical protein MTO96_013193 [Rhipicephalus appendiculatus]